MLVWKNSEPRVNPFDAVAGESYEHEVHHAISSSVSDRDVTNDLVEIIHKALMYMHDASTERSAKMLILWDMVYFTLTIVSTDETMLLDERHVTKCTFAGLEVHAIDVSRTDSKKKKRAMAQNSGVC